MAFLALGSVPISGAQQPRVAHIGFLTSRSRPVPPDQDAFSDAFAEGMRARGYVEGLNLVIDWRYLGGQGARLDVLAAELVRSRVDVIVAYGTAAVQAAQRATPTIPIVIAAAVDPVGSGLVGSLARPGGTTTGLSAIAVDLGPKHLELLKALPPRLGRVAVLTNPGNASHAGVTKSLETAASKVGVEVVMESAHTPAEIGTALAHAARSRAGAMIVAGDAFFSGQGALVSAATIQNRMPTIGNYREHVQAGGLMSYGQDIADFHRQLATFVDRILKGAKPSDLPVEQPTKFELVINARTAARLAITIPNALRLRADEVIQ